MVANWQNVVVGIILVMVIMWLARALMRSFNARRYAKCSTCDDATCPYRRREGDK